MNKSIKRIVYPIQGCEIEISDVGQNPKPNPNKYDFNQTSRVCLYKNCNKKISKSRKSGLCNEHQTHQHDLLLTLKPKDQNSIRPVHTEVIDDLVEWERIENFDLCHFIEDIKHRIIGNIPDVTSLASEVTYKSVKVPSLMNVFDSAVKVVQKHFSNQKELSSKIVSTKNGDIPIIVLATVFVGLIVCEEANRGDRWHCTFVRKDCRQIKNSGGMMPLMYYSSKKFTHDIEMGKSQKKFF